MYLHCICKFFLSVFAICMDEAGDTPKKIVCDSPKCFLCGLIVSSENQVKVFGKSLFDIAGLINSILGMDVSLYSSRNLFVCTNKCYKRLTKFERIKKSLESLQNEIEEDFKKASVLSSRTKQMLKDCAPNVNKRLGDNSGPHRTGKSCKIVEIL